MKATAHVGTLVTLLFLAVGSTAHAEKTKTVFKVKGDTAIATFDAFDPSDPCIENFVTVVASDLMEKQKPGGKTATVRTLLTVGQTDVCLGITLFSGEGETPVQSFEFANDLGSATLTTTVPVFDFGSFQFYDFHVNLTWVGLGEPVYTQSKETFVDKDLGLKIKTKLKGIHNDAEAVGTVVGFGGNFTPEPSVSAELQTQNVGTITIEKTF